MTSAPVIPSHFPDSERYVKPHYFPHSEITSAQNPFVDKTSKNVVEALADNVKRRMAESGLSGPTIYAKTGVSVGTLSRITNEGVATGIDNVERLAEIFGCEPWELLVPDDETREAIIAVRAIQRRPKD
jgi:uncharacterized protein YerC